MKNDLSIFKSNSDWFPESNAFDLNKSGKRKNKTVKKSADAVKWFLFFILTIGYVVFSFSQTNLNDLNYKAESTFQPTIKDAVKYSDLPEIKDTVNRIKGLNYAINSKPLFPVYEVSPVNPAKMQNEPLNKLYHSMIKVGYGPFYTMPYGEFFINSTRSRDMAYGAHLKHFSSSAQLKGVGFSGFSDNEAEIFGKKFYKKHTLSGDLNYKRNVVHFYGYDTLFNKITDKDYTKQRYQLFEPKVQLQSHYTDSNKINHNIKLSYYNLQDLYYAEENNVKLNTELSTFVNKEHLHVNILADYYNHKKPIDTISDFIFSLNPYFEANGKKWHADLGLNSTINAFNGVTKFYFYPQLNIHYDIYENMIIPFAGVTGGLIKNSMRSLSNENPFINPQLNYANTNNKFNFYGGLRGNLSSKTSYEAKALYGQYDNMHFFVIDYSTPIKLNNKFNVIYDNTSFLNINGKIKYQYKEKINFITQANYYHYQPKTLDRAYHKPNFDITLTGLYNLKSKLIFKADFFVIGNQWGLTEVLENNNYVLKPILLNSFVDVNMGGEYRYSKMLSFFVNFNNIANIRYYRWQKYPTQRFNMMLGLTFVPF